MVSFGEKIGKVTISEHFPIPFWTYCPHVSRKHEKYRLISPQIFLVFSTHLFSQTTKQLLEWKFFNFSGTYASRQWTKHCIKIHNKSSKPIFHTSKYFVPCHSYIYWEKVMKVSIWINIEGNHLSVVIKTILDCYETKLISPRKRRSS